MTRTKLRKSGPWVLAVVVGLGGACNDRAAVDNGAVDDGPAAEIARQAQAELDVAIAQSALTAAQLKAVRPVLRCVERLSSTSYQAHFGYASSSSSAITIPVGFNNRFFPNPIGRGQPTVFVPGSQTDVVQVPFSSNSAIVWILGTTLQIAVRTSNPCPVTSGTGGAVGTGGRAGAGGAGGRGGAGGVAATGGSGTGGSTPKCPSTCDDHNPCTTDLCSASTGFLCSNVTVPNGTACSDGNACTTGDRCTAGACTPGTARVCGASDQCHVAGVCDTVTGACSNPAAANGTSCSDANMCTTGDACQAGLCIAPVVIPPTHCAGGALCDTCTGDNCIASTDGCDGIGNATDRGLCETLYACFTNPVNNCVSLGDPLRCWCGSNPDTCQTDNAPPTQANGPCLQAVIAAAHLTPTTYDAGTIKLRLVDPDFPLGRAVNLTSCRGSYCSAECRVP